MLDGHAQARDFFITSRIGEEKQSLENALKLKNICFRD